MFKKVRYERMRRILTSVLMLTLISGASSVAYANNLAAPDQGIADTRYRSMSIQGINIAYREAGDPANLAIVFSMDSRHPAICIVS